MFTISPLSPGLHTAPDTSIIITSNLIPTHPDVKMINDTIQSLDLIEGLHPASPIFITVDFPKERKDATPENLQRLQSYVENLHHARKDSWGKHPVTILNSYTHKHISNTVRWAVDRVDTEFLYYVQHDFRFVKYVNDTALVQSFRQSPDEIRMVRFGKRKNYGRPFCGKSIASNGLTLSLTKWSDNNHFTTKKHYDEILDQLGMVSRPLEGPMMNAQGRDVNCTDKLRYQWLYNHDGPYIEHLDGRLSQN